MNQVYVLQGTHPYVPGCVLSVHATKDGAARKAVELINIIRQDVCAGHKVFEATPENYVQVLEDLKEHYAAVHENDNEAFDVWIEPMEVRL